MSDSRRLLVSCGEPSGDTYAGDLVAQLQRRLPISGFGLGGDRLETQGFRLIAHVRELAVAGIFEVVMHLGRLRRILAAVIREIDRNPPDLGVIIDYPEINLRIARALKRRGIPVVYYVSPQFWAWRKGRTRLIRDNVEKVLCIFPFERAFFEEWGVSATYVGHPLVDLVKVPADRAAFTREVGLDLEQPLVAILPGSRPGELHRNLPPLAEALRRLRAARPELQFVAAAAPALDPDALRRGLRDDAVRVVSGRTHAAVAAANLAIVASGTATVETALLDTPMVVVYRINPLSYLLGRPLVDVPHYAMVNLIAERRLVPELIQGEFTPDNVVRHSLALLDEPARAEEMRAGLADVRQRLGAGGASARAADEIAELLAAG